MVHSFPKLGFGMEEKIFVQQIKTGRAVVPVFRYLQPSQTGIWEGGGVITVPAESRALRTLWTMKMTVAATFRLRFCDPTK